MAVEGCFSAETDYWTVGWAVMSAVDRTAFQSRRVMRRVRSLGYEMRKPSLLLKRRNVDVLLSPRRARPMTVQERAGTSPVPADHVQLRFNARTCHN